MLYAFKSIKKKILQKTIIAQQNLRRPQHIHHLRIVSTKRVSGTSIGTTFTTQTGKSMRAAANLEITDSVSVSKKETWRKLVNLC